MREPPGVDLARTCVEFGDLLRRRGVPVSPDQTLAFQAALHLLTPTVRTVYLTGRTVLVNHPSQLTVYDAAFVEYFGAGPDGEGPAGRSDLHDRLLAATAEQAVGIGDDPVDGGEGDDLEDEVVLAGGDVARLVLKDFASMSPEERQAADRIVRSLRPELPWRRSRRRAPARRGRLPDTRRTLRRSLATDGEPLHHHWRAPDRRPRPITLVLDVSASMTPYAQALLNYGHAVARAGQRVEVFTVGTELTRITEHLAARHPDAALRRAAAAVPDWDGGTRLGTALGELLTTYGARAALRGAIVVICSDGLDRDPPALLASRMARLARRAHRIVWLNPLKGDPRYRPLAGGMAAAVAHVDVFLPGHNVASLREMSDALAGID